MAIFFMLLLSITGQTAIYKYKDENGKWVFSDANGRDKDAKNVEELEVNIKSVEVSSAKPFVEKVGLGYELRINNPYHAPLQIKVYFIHETKKYIEKLLPGVGLTTLYRANSPIEISGYRLNIGDPKAEEGNTSYLFPVKSSSLFKITQAFNGRFSHHKTGNKYAVDIAMQVGTYIAAARAGTVMWIKQDYYMGGKRQYFLDKANAVKILHDDGTYAVYAHILQDSALVQPGDIVQVGQIIARSGSSGFSTGPHLHFVIRKNVGYKTVSVPFTFKIRDGQIRKPERGQSYLGL